MRAAHTRREFMALAAAGIFGRHYMRSRRSTLTSSSSTRRSIRSGVIVTTAGCASFARLHK